jgi:hypothetical protein
MTPCISFLFDNNSLWLFGSWEQEQKRKRHEQGNSSQTSHIETRVVLNNMARVRLKSFSCSFSSDQGISKCFQTSISIHLHVSLALRLLLCRAPSENEKQSIEEEHYRAFVSDASQNVIWSKQTATHLRSSSPAIAKVSFVHHDPLLVMHHSLQEMTKINKPKWQFIVCCHALT